MDSTSPRYKRGLESFMYRKANELIEAAEVFTKERDGTDDTTKLLETEGLTMLLIEITKPFFISLLKNIKAF
uniref:Uncharacterized protein n=1 Tax=Rhizophagus irregularis (strain DAOM 181602 / DAOM 197198 / MUCL 43194) TaxID=747089 RepID=U9THH0_RHIID